MKQFFLAMTAAFALSACATTGPSPYGPIAQNGLGFENQRIEQDRFRISYTGRSVQESRDYVLLRAAEIADAEGYSHFKIIGGSTFEDAPHSSGVSSSIGVGFGSGRGYYGRRRSGTSVGVGINVNDLARTLQGRKVTEEVEVRLLRSGGSDQDGRVYNAREVMNNIRPAIFADDVN